jgi:hypothetical protein
VSVFSFSDLAFMGAVGGGIPGFDPDASSYILSVEAADGQQLESGVRDAINAFVVGCKADGIWNAIKASCILAGARTLAGALVPLVGAAPTRFGTEGGWGYNRKTGLQGNGSDNYLNSNRNNNADPQNDNHNSVYATELSTPSSATTAYIGAGGFSTGANNILSGSQFIFRSRSQSNATRAVSSPGLIGKSRSDSSGFAIRASGSSTSSTIASQTPFNANVFIFGRSVASLSPSNARLAFYSIGESLDLALLDARVTTLMNDFAAAIP